MRSHPVPRLQPTRVALAALLACSGLSAPVGAQPVTPAQPATELERVEIIGTTPIPGTGIARERVPANVQHFNLSRLRDAQALNLPELMRQQMGSATVVETQGNPYQMEVTFRGFTASPLLGQPQGLSVFLDGVRLNEAFGDVVNWDLVPRNALRSITLLPGSNPVFGLNTLGGALVLGTKSGLTDPGTEAELSIGSHGRRNLELSHGMRLGENSHLFVAGSVFDEDGWRAHSPSRIRQVYAKFGQKDGPLDWSLSMQGASTDLIGNGLLPETLLAVDRAQIYTRPDQTLNRLGGLTFQGGVDLGSGERVQALLYARQLKTRTVNGDLNDEWDGVSELTGVENRTAGKQRASGLALQWSQARADNQLTLGVSHDRSRTSFTQTEAEGELDDTRAVTELEDEELNASITGTTRTNSVFLTNTWSASPTLHITAAGRYNHTRVSTVDVGRAQGLTSTTLDSEHSFRRFNPSLGATWQASPGLTVYGNLSQGSRAPSPIELGCSDPDNPCVLPNALQADPPLRQVVSTSLELGARGALGAGWRWNAGVFSTHNQDDILFISNQRAAGYFQNFGKTRRQGIELGLSGREGDFDIGLNFTHQRATFGSGACLVSEANSTAETSALCTGADEIEVRSGDRLPGIPRNILKVDLGWRPVAGVRIGASVAAQGGLFVRGNENNRHQPDGVDFNGSGRIGGFALVNLNAAWQITPALALVAKINNVFDRRVVTGGMLGENAFNAAGALQAPADWRDEQFVGPAAPRAIGLALRLRLGS